MNLTDLSLRYCIFVALTVGSPTPPTTPHRESFIVLLCHRTLTTAAAARHLVPPKLGSTSSVIARVLASGASQWCQPVC